MKSAFPEKYRDGDDYRHDTAEIINCNTIIILAYLSEFKSVEINEMKEYAKTHRKFSFRRLMENQHSNIQLIVTFLAILELMKMGHVHAEQADLFDDIHIEVITDPETWKNLTEFAEE